MIDSGSAVSLITKTLANQILRTTKSAKWITKREKRDLKTFSNDPINVLGHLETTVAYNNWIDGEANLTVVVTKSSLAGTSSQALALQLYNNNNQTLVNVSITLIVPHEKLKRHSAAISPFIITNWSFQDTCSEIKISLKVYSKASKKSAHSNKCPT